MCLLLLFLVFVKKVLISTYWNVNVVGVAFLPVFATVLISTYWNVNA